LTRSIIHGIPIKDFILNKKNFPKTEDATYLSFVYYKKKNRAFLKKQLKRWYAVNGDKLIWIVDTASKKAASNWPFALHQNPAQGYYVVSPSK